MLLSAGRSLKLLSCADVAPQVAGPLVSYAPAMKWLDVKCTSFPQEGKYG